MYLKKDDISQIENTDISYFVSKPRPLDAKMLFIDLNAMRYLGPNNEKAYAYYPGMLAIDGSTGNWYVWKEWDGSEPGVLPNGFTYPNGYVRLGIDYSGKTFNFVLLDTNAGNGFVLPTEIVNDVFHIESDGITSVTATQSGNAGIQLIRVYLNGLRQALNDDYTVSGNTIIFTEPLEAEDIVVLDYRQIN